MKVKTEQKIIDAALQVFSKKGYSGATTLNIARKSGFSEKTLFEKFKSKENLFNTMVTQKGLEMLEFYEDNVLVDEEYKNTREFLENLIENLNILGKHYFPLFHLTISEKTRIHEPLMSVFNLKLSEYLEEKMPGKDIDYMTFGLTISAFMYMIYVEKNLGRGVIDYDTVLKNFIENSLKCLS